MAKKDKRQVTDSPTWATYEPEVSHYFQHEPGAKTANLDPDSIGHGGSEPRPPQFPPGADYWTMMTVAERLTAADRVMPFRGARFGTVDEKHSDGIVRPRQVLWEPGSPSASMVLRAAYGTLACKYEDSAPNGAQLLAQAKAAYIDAAPSVAFRRRPTVRERLKRSWERAFGPGTWSGR